MNDYTFRSEYGHLTKAILEAAADVIAFLVHHGEPNPLSEMERKNLPNRAERDGRVAVWSAGRSRLLLLSRHRLQLCLCRRRPKRTRPRHALSRLQSCVGRLRRAFEKNRGNFRAEIGTQVGQTAALQSGPRFCVRWS